MEHETTHYTEAYQEQPPARPAFRPYATFVLIGINVFVFLIMFLSGVDPVHPTTADLMHWGAQIRFAVTDGQYWRMFTCNYLHIGLLHLLVNMYSLYMLGRYLEQIIGKTYFVIFYVCAGLSGSAASIWWNENTASAGASGAIFGLLGVLIAIFTTNIIEKNDRRNALMPLLQTLGLNLLIGFSSGVIDNAGHIGGLIGGVIGGYSLYLVYYFRGNRRWRIIGPAIGVTAILGLCIGLVAATPKGVNADEKINSNLERYAKFEIQLNQIVIPDTTASIKREIFKKQVNLLLDSMDILVRQSQQYFDTDESPYGYFQLMLRLGQSRRMFIGKFADSIAGDSTVSGDMRKSKMLIEKQIDSLKNWKMK